MIPHSAFRIPHLRWATAIASVAIAGLYLWGLGSFGFLDPDEGMYAEIAREMLATGDWIVPRFNGIPYIEKPPLMYWLTAGTFAVLGPSEFSARLWKVLPILGTVGLAYLLGRRLFSEMAGALSGLILATMLGTFLFSRITQMDPLLVFAVTLSVYGIVAAHRPSANEDSFDREDGGSTPSRPVSRKAAKNAKNLPPEFQSLAWRSWREVRNPGPSLTQGGKEERAIFKLGWVPGLCFWVGIAVGVLSKGLPGMVIPLALLFLWSLIGRELTTARKIWSLGGLAVLFILTVPWHLVAAMRVPGFCNFYVVDNQLLRFLGGRAYVEDQQSPLGTLAFLGVTVIALFPWTPFLAAALTAHGSRLIGLGKTRRQANCGLRDGIEEGAAVRRYESTRVREYDEGAGGWGYIRTFVRSYGFDFDEGTEARGDGGNSRIHFLLAWAFLVIGGFSLSSFKLEYYTFPALPALAVLTAAFLVRLDDRGRSGEARRQPFPGELSANAGVAFRLLQAWNWVAVIGGLLFSAGAAWAHWAGLFSPQNVARGLALWATNYRIMLEQEIPVPLVSSGYFGALLIGGGLMWTAGFAAALGWLRRGRIMRGALAVAGVGVVLCLLAGSVLYQVESHHSLKPLATYLNGVLRPTDILIHERGLEKGGGLLFYTGRRVLVLNGVQGDLEFGSRLPGYGRAFIDTEVFRILWQNGSRVFLVTHLPRTVSAISAVSIPSPVLVAQTGTRWLYSNGAP